ncbi:hypothetical protein AC579_2873 [Pseudocercospora musae]|uniref:Uncharacterized protein n=1 Tax=Pseudocercospora musae TaxID=113226 RepID=A0A139IUK9_9PEZI|nr:hypothetical protein AC579_2873 [Pseudocercospora musae]
MADNEDNGLLGIEVDPDDYAEAAAGDTPSVPRTFQSEADFQVQKASYTAKINQGNIYAEVVKALPVLDPSAEPASGVDVDAKLAKTKLSKKEVQLLGYAVGEMYFDRKYQDIIGLCQRVGTRCEVDEKLSRSLEKWTSRCRERRVEVLCYQLEIFHRKWHGPGSAQQKYEKFGYDSDPSKFERAVLKKAYSINLPGFDRGEEFFWHLSSGTGLKMAMQKPGTAALSNARLSEYAGSRGYTDLSRVLKLSGSKNALRTWDGNPVQEFVKRFGLQVMDTHDEDEEEDSDPMSPEVHFWSRIYDD